MNQAFSIPGIRCIRWIPCSSIPMDIELAAEAEITPLINSSVDNSVDFRGQPTLTCEITNENTNKQGTATLTFASITTDFPREKVGVLIQSVSGQWFLMGSHDFNVAISSSFSMGTTDTSKITTYTVTYSAIWPLIEVTVIP